MGQGGGARASLLARYGDQFGRLVERRMAAAAQVAARQDAEAAAEALRGEMRQRQEAQSHLAFLAHHDPLTALANRALMGERLREEMEAVRCHGGQLALFCLDLDHFKDVNDTLGHAAGDALLREVAQRLRANTRASEVVARMGGDEFAVLQTAVAGPDEVRALAERLLRALNRPVDIAGKRLFIGASAGIARFPGDGEVAEALLGNADMALYQAKREGRNGFRLFDAAMNAAVHRRTALEQALHEAVALNQVSLAFQPQVELRGGRVTAVEALLRWDHPVLGMVSPEEFVPVAEHCGLIGAIGTWALREACRQLVRWDAAGLPPLCVAVNLASAQFKGGDVPRLVADALAATGLAPHRLELEITETGVMHDIRDAGAVLGALRALGVMVAIDDFGTGYSSLGRLRGLAVDRIKIDRSFVADLANSEDAAAVVRAIVTLGHSLRLGVVAEGVETAAHARALRDLGCEAAQGFFFGRPMPADALAATLAGAPQREDIGVHGN